jgi:hypothetical protein
MDDRTPQSDEFWAGLVFVLMMLYLFALGWKWANG